MKPRIVLRFSWKITILCILKGKIIFFSRFFSLNIYDMQIDGKRGAGRPKQTWKKLTEKDCREWKLTTVDPQERSTWRSGVRSAMRAASQLPGKGPTDVDDAPAPAR